MSHPVGRVPLAGLLAPVAVILGFVGIGLATIAVAIGLVGIDATPLAPSVAHAQSAVVISTSDYTVANTGDTFTVVLSVNPAGNSVNAVQYRLTYDPAIIKPVLGGPTSEIPGAPECTGLNGALAACGPLQPTNEVRLSSFRFTGAWSGNEPIDVLEVSFQGQGVAGVSALSLVVDRVFQPGNVDLASSTQDGSVQVGSPEPTATPTSVPTATQTPAPTATTAPTPTSTPIPEPTATPAADATPTPTAQPTATSAPDATPTATAEPSPTPEATATAEAGLLPTAPTAEPATPTPTPTPDPDGTEPTPDPQPIDADQDGDLDPGDGDTEPTPSPIAEPTPDAEAAATEDQDSPDDEAAGESGAQDQVTAGNDGQDEPADDNPDEPARTADDPEQADQQQTADDGDSDQAAAGSSAPSTMPTTDDRVQLGDSPSSSTWASTAVVLALLAGLITIGAALLAAARRENRTAR